MAALMGSVVSIINLTYIMHIIIWLQSATTNHNPRVIGCYYLEAIEDIGGK